MKSIMPLIILSACLLGGCAKMNKKECQLADWQLLGIKDGSDGEPMTVFAERSEACASYGTVVNRTAYMQGRETGLKSYCKPYKGYEVGEKGARYHGVCTGKQESAFLAAYNKGYRRYEQKKAVSVLDDKIKRLERNITRNTQEKSQIESRLLMAQTTEERTQLLLKLNQITQTISNARAELARLSERRLEKQWILDAMPRGL